MDKEVEVHRNVLERLARLEGRLNKLELDLVDTDQDLNEVFHEVGVERPSHPARREED